MPRRRSSREKLEQERGDATSAEVRDCLDVALETLEEAHVNTIHGFCAELLRERPVEARVDPLFSVLTEPQADRAVRTRVSRLAAGGAAESARGNAPRAAPHERVRRFAGGDADGPDRSPPWRRPHARRVARLSAPWDRPPFDRDGEIDRLVAALHRFADLTSAPSSPRDNLYIDTDAVRRLSRQIRLEESFGQRDLDGWEARLVDLTRDRGFSRTRKGSGYRSAGT